MKADKHHILQNDILSLIGQEEDREGVVSSFASTMDLLSDGVMYLNSRWEIQYINKSAKKYLGKDRNYLLGKNIWEEFPGLVRTFFYEAFYHSLMNETPVEFDEYYSANDTWFHVKAYPKQGGLLIVFQDITQKHLAMEVVEESYRTLFQKHPDAVCSVDMDGNMLAVNSAFQKLFPINEKLLLGSNYLEFVPESKKHILKSLFNYAINGKPQAAECNFSGNVTKPFHLLITALPIIVQSNIIGVYGIIKDITSERESLEKYREVFKTNELILESVKEGIASFDNDFNVIMWNQAAAEMTGYSKEELDEYTLGRLFNKDKNVMLRDICPDVSDLSKETVVRKNDVSIFRKDGKPLIIEYVMTPMVMGEKVVGTVFTFRDVTEKKKSEELLYQSEKLSAVGQLAAGIAHEIRNPLTSLKGFLQLIQMSGEGKQEYFDIMNSEFARIEQILNELLILSKPQTSAKAVCSLNSLLDHIVTLLNTQAIIKNIYIYIEEETEDLRIRCISNQIKQVFMNFIKNAIEAMDNGKITVCLKKEKTFAVVEIIDEGCGIPESMLSRVGEPFFTTKEKGTGLGLMVSYQIIEDHDGDIEVESTEGVGTKFTIRLPLYLEDC
ncbi:PAS domain-containing protein [Salipaludibacillus aurantiacus]|uniref:histidine kinase n=1 Tax=Salipaludibacillus aurantiacus TaxID=1601833 RepID=A0A1H9RUW8_9BACI|nr:PAS domain S-box protein [Salipaludibacillus aurantiacus]SER76447.1 PAS domain S-box-containing protein [Salipaludibacillus aurantiacus]